MKEHEAWWQNNLPAAENMDTGAMGKTFRGWLRGTNAESRLVLRDILKEYKYESMLDCAAGLCDEYDGLKLNNVDIEYTALDITPKLVEYNSNRGINIKEGSIEKLPFKTKSFDLVYARHVLEHLDYYEKALSEMIRVAKRGVIHTFFRKPMSEPDNIEIYSPETKLFQNVYDIDKMNTFISRKRKVSSYEWVQPEILKHKMWTNGEVILHIRMK